MFSCAIITWCLISATSAQSTIVNLINPLWALPVKRGGGNYTNELAASVVGVDSTATTYSIGCRPNLTTVTCRLGQSHLPEIFTQGSTSMHWSVSDDDPQNTFSFTAEYTFSTTLASVVTATEIGIQGLEGGSFVDTQYPATTSTQSYKTIYSSGDATWYPIPITGGIEKLSITTAATLGPESTSPTGTAPSSTSSSAAQSLGAESWFIFSVAGLAAGFMMDL